MSNMAPRWINKFEIKPNVWVYEPSEACREEGAEILRFINRKWKIPTYYYHLRRGGHVEALRVHIENDWFVSLDIKEFFQSTSRSRVTRTLRNFLPYEKARIIAKVSTVSNFTNDKFSHFIPFGYVQSPLLATICLHYSSFGQLIKELSRCEDVKLSVYMDDIILSSSSLELLERTKTLLEESASRSHYKLNTLKVQGPAERITAFNIDLSHQSMVISPKRLLSFLVDFNSPDSDNLKREGIRSYIYSVNSEQAEYFTFPKPI
ncbi:reverse transcriptase domain-containing protein [Yersinia enterocolitica]|uniref:reverse transcriptase domain-containing protein n=1 Tax=Yersinia enterocolitica TaxID=630 RepID=UPI0005DB090F|nr:reverse transcriptase domain-containing protein [Yersinia enterocolitica]CNJ97586.1 Retron-type reverse transcriptase [Yersinia enterocolitica]